MRAPRALPTAQLAMPGPMLPGQGQPMGQNSLTANDIWRVIRANFWLIAITMVLMGGAGYATNMWLAAHHSRYTSVAYLQVKLDSQKPVVNSSVIITNPQDLEIEQNSQTKLLTREDLLTKVLSGSQPIRQTQWFQQFISYPNGQQKVDAEAAKTDLLEHLEVVPVPNSYLIRISMSWSVPKDCKTIVEEIANEHIKQQKELTSNELVVHSSGMEQLVLKYEQQIGDKTTLMDRLAEELGAAGVGIGPGSNSKEFELQQLISEQLGALKVLGLATTKRKTFEKQMETNSAPALQEALQRSQTYVDYRRIVDGLTGDYQDLLATQGDANQRTKSIKRRLEYMKGKLADTQDDIESRTAEFVRANLADDASAAEFALQRVKESLTQIRAEISQLARKRYQYGQLDRDVTALRASSDHVKDEQDKAGILQGNGKWSRIDWESSPSLPDHPTFPRLVIIMPIALALGLALSLGIAFLRELTDNSVRSPRDVARVGNLALLGMIPHESDDRQAAGARLPLAIFEAPHSMIAEQFRQVRTRLQHTASLDTTRSILVTSCSPEDGKTTVAVNLAAGLALNGRRILLVDANFRRPNLHNVFNLENEVGFGDVLNSLDFFEEAVRETEVPNLSVLSSGQKPSNPTELLESQLLIDFIERALEEYDHVIFDSGPLLMVSDSIALAPRVDGVITVVRARGNSRGMLGRLRDELRRLKAEHLGIVLNAVRVHNGGYYGPMIKNYYAYQNG
ncbi:MAG TPA: polysaccharide biosynthesis tyrosine autokinase [Tepidisphaeraceae bacterium]|nr:polysaccharide biosynthesis tyrosine autokinase [Tepidisphaeraceae bacterium]